MSASSQLDHSLLAGQWKQSLLLVVAFIMDFLSSMMYLLCIAFFMFSSCINIIIRKNASQNCKIVKTKFRATIDE